MTEKTEKKPKVAKKTPTKKTSAKKPAPKPTSTKPKIPKKPTSTKPKTPKKSTGKKAGTSTAKPRPSDSADDIGIVIVDDDITVDKEKANEERRAYLEEARSQEAFD